MYVAGCFCWVLHRRHEPSLPRGGRGSEITHARMDRLLFVIPASLAGLWWLLPDGEPVSWIIGLPAVAAAVWAGRRLGKVYPGPVSASGMLRFVPLCLWGSVRRGVDVALRTLNPRLRVWPGFSQLHTELIRTDARVFLVNCTNLLPGTLTADRQGSKLCVHLLDQTMDAESELRRVERAVARVFPSSL